MAGWASGTGRAGDGERRCGSRTGRAAAGATGAPLAVDGAGAEVDEGELAVLADDPRVVRRDAGGGEHDVVVRRAADA